MLTLEYYYNPIVKCDEIRRCYIVKFYITDGKQSKEIGSIESDSPTGALKLVQDVVDAFNKPKSWFGRNGQILRWWRFKKSIRNQKK